MQLSFIYPLDSELLTIITLTISLALVIGAIVLSITTGQGGSRLQGQTANGDAINRDDDKHWKAGVFYFNKEDPALFLEKRFGVGWTINLARPLAWGLFLAIILLPIGLALLLV